MHRVPSMPYTGAAVTRVVRILGLVSLLSLTRARHLARAHIEFRLPPAPAGLLDGSRGLLYSDSMSDQSPVDLTSFDGTPDATKGGEIGFGFL